MLDFINQLQSTTTYLRADPIFEGEESGIVYLPQDMLDSIDHPRKTPTTRLTK